MKLELKGILREIAVELSPEQVGRGVLSFIIELEEKTYEINIPEIRIFASSHKAIHWADEQSPSSTNVSSFTKEQSWKMDFKTEMPRLEKFGSIIKTTALIKPCVAGEAIISSKSNGVIDLQSKHLSNGLEVRKKESLLVVSGKGLASNNSSVRFVEAKNNFEKAKQNYFRLKELEKDKLITRSELLKAKNEYENTKVVFNNLERNFSLSGQLVYSPIDGFINKLFVNNGEYVEAGHPLLSITKNQRLVLSADVQQKYASILPLIRTANIKSIHNNKVYTLEDLNGEILSYGKSANTNNYMLPIELEVDNTDDFVSGGFVEVFLKAESLSPKLTVPISALIEEQGNFFVYVQINPELFEKREVKTGVGDGFRIEILAGLKREERIVSKGAVIVKLSQVTGSLDAHSGHVH